jgi:hypothetical protein
VLENAFSGDQNAANHFMQVDLRSWEGISKLLSGLTAWVIQKPRTKLCLASREVSNRNFLLLESPWVEVGLDTLGPGKCRSVSWLQVFSEKRCVTSTEIRFGSSAAAQIANTNTACLIHTEPLQFPPIVVVRSWGEPESKSKR